MKLYIRPEHFQTVHYYFFSLGMFSLTIAFMFPLDSLLSLIFMSFYAVHSAIAWYMSWFLYKRVKALYIINSKSYITHHVILTLLSGGLAVAFYCIFAANFEAMMTSVITVNFFVIFLGFLWYLMGAMKIAEKFVDWQEARKLQVGRDMLFRFRKRRMIDLLDDETIKSYKFGTDSTIDQLFMSIKMKSEMGEDFGDDVREAEVKIAEVKIQQLEGKTQKLERGGASPADMNLIKSYREAIVKEKKRIMDYEKRFYERFKKASEEGRVQRP
jgi:hypothetical protein